MQVTIEVMEIVMSGGATMSESASARTVTERTQPGVKSCTLLTGLVNVLILSKTFEQVQKRFSRRMTPKIK